MSDMVIPVNLSIRDKNGEPVSKKGVFKFSGRLKRSFRLTFDEKMEPVVTLPLSMLHFGRAPQTLVDRYGSFFTEVYHKHLRLSGKRNSLAGRLNALTDEFISKHHPSDEWIADMAEKTLIEMTEFCRELYVRMGMRKNFKSVSVRLQKSRWGSCSSTGALSFNCLIMLLPETCRYYLAVHEMCHLFEMNHSERFWRLVEKYCPDYVSIEQVIKERGKELFPVMRELQRRKVISVNFGGYVLAGLRRCTD
ncbi:M48 family metallopeptidase [Ruminobacter sp.]|uniref:M48 metallopeptidase family protein n=1 Tax=Ruminobacter sp. TaxID=2774296 RepID=UPI0038634166